MYCKCGCKKIIKSSPYYPKSMIIGDKKKIYKQVEFCKGHRLSPKLKIVRCEFCNKQFKKRFCKSLNFLKHSFCSRKCAGQFKHQKTLHICFICKKQFYRKGRRYLKNKSNKIFCSNQCAHIFKQKENHPNWKGGKQITKNGYIFIHMPDHPYNLKKYVFEHRLVVEKQLNRYLAKTEQVHHLNKIKSDNRPENLIAFTHRRFHNSFEAGFKIPVSSIIFDGRKILKTNRNNLCSYP